MLKRFVIIERTGEEGQELYIPDLRLLRFFVKMPIGFCMIHLDGRTEDGGPRHFSRLLN